MNLYNSLRTGLSGLLSSQTSLRTTGHNISNANTPGYSRQRTILESRTPVDMEQYKLGRGSSVNSIERMVDQTLEKRIQDSNSSLESLSEQRKALKRTEQIFGELSEADIGNSLARFFSSLEDLANNPEDTSVRTQVATRGSELTDQVQFVSDRLQRARQNIDDQVQEVAREIDRQINEIARLNREIVKTEGGGTNRGTANDLRDQRDLLLRKLSKNLDIKTRETESGAINVRAGTRVLVFRDKAENIVTRTKVEGNLEKHIPQIESTGTELPSEGGRLGGLIQARDNDLASVRRDLDRLAEGIKYEFNKLHSEGVGLKRLKSVTGEETILPPAIDNAVSGADPSASPTGPPLATDGTVDTAPTDNSIVDDSLAGLPDDHFNNMRLVIKDGPNRKLTRRIKDFDGSSGKVIFDSPLPERLSAGTEFQISGLNHPVKNGSFDVVVTNENSGKQETFNIEVDLDGIGTDDDLQDIVDEINSKVSADFPGVTARVTNDNRFEMESSSDNVRFRFDNDSSNFLAAAGVNTFFTGNNASQISVREEIQNRVDLITAARSGPGGDNTNAVRMLELRNQKVLNEGSETLEENYQSLIGEIASNLDNLKNRTDNQKNLNEQLMNQRDRVSGVNLDEEAVNMIEFQKQFQASARFISTVNQMLSSLLQAT